MPINKVNICLTLLGIFIIICIPAIIKVNNNYKKNLYNSVVDKIIINTKKCYNDEKCIEEKITLKELYELKYLSNLTNPVTKEYFNEKSYVIKKDNNYVFKEIKNT